MREGMTPGFISSAALDGFDQPTRPAAGEANGRVDAMIIQPEKLAGSTEYRPGDQVRAKFGDGLMMVVAEVYPRIYVYRYRCSWRDKGGRERSELFRFGELIPVN
jgi:uncharacterized protein YodC (DUF2158 family)